MNWKFWENKKARVAVSVAAAAVVVAVGTAVAVNLAQPGRITQAQAQSIALEHAGVSVEEALSMEVTQDDGAYEVDFRTAERSYEYTIQGRSGQVTDYSYQPVNTASAAKEETSQAQTSSQASAFDEITQEQAKAIALEHAGVAEADATFYRAEKDFDDGRAVYEIEFYVGNTEYDYEIDQESGRILQFDSDIEGWSGQPAQTTSANSASSSSSASQASPSAGITEEQAKAIALEHAGVAEVDATFYRVHEDRDHGRNTYEVEFYACNTEYDYEIDKTSGEVLSYDSDIEGWAAVDQTGGSPVTLEQARDLVVARVPGLAAEDVRIHGERDDGRQVFEGEAWYDGTEYEFEIDASTGAFLNWSAEPLRNR